MPPDGGLFITEQVQAPWRGNNPLGGEAAFLLVEPEQPTEEPEVYQSPSRGTFRKLMYHITTEKQSSNCAGKELNHSSTAQSGFTKPFYHLCRVRHPDSADFPTSLHHVQQITDRHHAPHL